MSAHSVSRQEEKKKGWTVENLHNGCGRCRRRSKTNTARGDFFSSQVICDKRNATTKGSACATACTWDQFRRKALIHTTRWRVLLRSPLPVWVLGNKKNHPAKSLKSGNKKKKFLIVCRLPVSNLEGPLSHPAISQIKDRVSNVFFLLGNPPPLPYSCTCN